MMMNKYNQGKSERVRKPKKIKDVLFPDEIERVFDFVKKKSKRHKLHYRTYVIFKCLFYFGLRRDELSKLRIENIDFERKRILVSEGKGKKDRYVGMYHFKLDDETIEDTLKKWIGKRKEGYLLQGRGNKGLSGDSIRKIVVDTIKEVGIKKDIAPHRLRASFATYLHSIGTPKPTIQNIMGHSNIDTTSIYINSDNTVEDESIRQSIRLQEIKKNWADKRKHADTIEKKIELILELLEIKFGL